MAQDDIVTNLQVLRASTKNPRAGDVFAMQLVDGRYVFGRVVSTEAHAGPSMPGAVLIYIYRTMSDTKEVPPVEEMRPDRMLVSPIMTNTLPWSKGYFETIANVALRDEDVLPQHCFRRWDGRYFDETRPGLTARSLEPVGPRRVLDDDGSTFGCGAGSDANDQAISRRTDPSRGGPRSGVRGGTASGCPG